MQSFAIVILTMVMMKYEWKCLYMKIKDERKKKS